MGTGSRKQQRHLRRRVGSFASEFGFDFLEFKRETPSAIRISRSSALRRAFGGYEAALRVARIAHPQHASCAEKCPHYASLGRSDTHYARLLADLSAPSAQQKCDCPRGLQRPRCCALGVSRLPSSVDVSWPRRFLVRAGRSVRRSLWADRGQCADLRVRRE